MAKATRTDRPPVRAAEVRTEPARERKTRTHKGTAVDQLRIPHALLHRFANEFGNDLQWNSETIVGVPATHFEQSRMQQQGWEPVLVGDFGGMFDYLMPKGHKGQIVYGGCRLDWRPLELTAEARTEELQEARGARGVEERKIKSGQVDNVDQDFMNLDHAKARDNTFVRKHMAPAPAGAVLIPE